MAFALPVPQSIFDAVMDDYRAGRIEEDDIFPEITERCSAFYVALPTSTLKEMLRSDLLLIPEGSA